MDGKGKILNISRGIHGGLNILLEASEFDAGELEKLQPDTLSITLKKYREKRSQNANAYFHVLVGKIAQAVDRSPEYIKNDLIAECGFQEYIDEDTPAVIKTNIEPEKMMEQELLHTRVCKVDAEDNGTLTFFYKVYRGSHTYNTKEMARLIDLTIYRAKELDIETLPPYEIERMKQQWENQAKAL